jgi:hypothetical protein
MYASESRYQSLNVGEKKKWKIDNEILFEVIGGEG